MNIQDDIDFASMLKQKLDKAMEDRGKVNIVVAGKTGVGKSTLINAVFQGNLAETGDGRPVTKTTREIQKEGIWKLVNIEIQLRNLKSLSRTRTKATTLTIIFMLHGYA